MMETSVFSSHRRPLSRATVTWIVAGTGLALVPHVAHLPSWISLLAAGSLAVRYAAAVFGHAVPMRGLLSLAAVAGCVGVFTQYGTLAGRDAGVALLVLMLALKLLEARNLRDGMLTIFLGYFVVASGFLYSQEIPLALYMGGVVIVLTAALTQMNQAGRGLSIRNPLRLATVLLMQSLPVMLVLFLLFPRVSGPLWATPNPYGAKTGLSDEMTLGNISRLARSDAVAFRATFEGEPPPPSERYWRGPVFGNFDGRSWSPLDNIGHAQIDTAGWRRPIRYTVQLEPHNRRWLFALDMPATVPEDVWLSKDYQLLAEQPVHELRRDRLTSYMEYRIGAELAPAARAAALALPDGIAPRTHRLATSLRRQYDSDIARVQAALEYLHEQPFVYTLSPPLLGARPVDEFLFETRAGFCEHYAGSFVVLMRAAGIPARVVTGYLGGEWNPLGGYMLVRQSDAHAWAEVWLSGQGWVRADPTAAVSPARIEQSLNDLLGGEGLPYFIRDSYVVSFVNHLRLLWDHTNFKWNEWVLAFGPQRQQKLLQRLGVKHPDWRILTTGMMLGIGLIIMLYAVIFVWRNKAKRPPPVVRLYRQFCTRLAKTGLARRSSEGPLDYAARVARTRPDLAEPVTKITRLYEGMRYGKYADQREDLRAMRQLMQSLRV